MKKIHLVSAALLILALAVPAAAAPDKPASSQPVIASGPAGPLGLKAPFKISVDREFIFVEYEGAADWTFPLDVSATCIPVAPTTSCGPSFPGGIFKAHYPTFPRGNHQAPQYGRTWGAGWIAVNMGLPAGSYKITATAAGNSSPVTSVRIVGAPSGLAVQVQPGVVPVVTPTKTP